MLNIDGECKACYTYDAWGNHVVYGIRDNGEWIVDSDGKRIDISGDPACATHIGVANPFRYRGYYFDTETGLYFLKTRYYDPAVGRFISQDDVSYLDPETVNGLNLYAYCGNNPVMRVDSNGTEWWKFWEWDWEAVGKGLASAGMFLGGLALTLFVPGAQRIGVGLMVTGAGGFVGGFISMANGGSFSSGWDIGTLVGGTIGLMIAAPQLAKLVLQVGGGGGLALVGGGAIMAGAIAIPVGAMAVGAAAAGLAVGLIVMMAMWDGGFPGWDPNRSPGDGWEWNEKGNHWKNGDEILHPDLNHGPPQGPHWDYRDRFKKWWRIFMNGIKKRK